MTLLIVEDNEDLSELIKEKMEECGFSAIITATASEALIWLENNRPFIIIIDYNLPDMNAKELILTLKRKGKLFPFIISTGRGDEHIAVDMMKLGARDYIVKDSYFWNRLPDVVKRVERELENEYKLKKAEEKIAHLSRAIEQSPVSIIITNLQGDIEYVNPKVLETTGYAAEEILGNNWQMFGPIELNENIHEPLWKNLSEGNEWRGEFHNIKKNGKLYWESALICPIKDENGRCSHYLSIKEDITERKNIEAELINAKELAEQSNRLKDAFMANISHEIRTPLNGVLGMTRIIHDRFSHHITKEEEYYFSAISLSSKRISRTIDMILNFSQLQVGSFPCTPKVVDITKIINELLKEFNVIALEKSIELQFENRVGKVELTIDEYCLTHAVSNLIDNALKFSDSGIVKLLLHEDDSGNIILDVTDTGCGISKEYMKQLFNPYSQEETGYGRGYEGVGLGLSLVKEFLRLNKAEITVQSKKDNGSTFTIKFNQKKLNEDTVSTLLPDVTYFDSNTTINTLTERLSVLVVEDDAINQMYIKSQLRNNYEVTMVSSAAKALEFLDGNPVDIILMDISLQKGMNGLDLTKLLKADNKYSAIPVIAVTGHASNEDRERIMNAGCDDYLAKPFETNELLEIIKRNSK